MDKIRLAVTMTCKDRKNTSIKCLNKLFLQDMDVYLVDDGSSDNSGQEIKKIFPNVVIFIGNGNLFWCGGMRIAYGNALKKGYDYYLWLNDDTMLFSNGIKTMLETSIFLYNKIKKMAIIGGSLKDEENNKLTYGGKTFRGFFFKTILPVKPEDKPKPCDLINGNCVLIPRAIAEKIGNLSTEFIHAAGDFDYCLKAKKHDFCCWITRGFVGNCSINFYKGLFKNKNIEINERLKKLKSDVYVKRIRDSLTFTKYYGGALWPLSYFKILIKMSILRIWFSVAIKLKNIFK